LAEDAQVRGSRVSFVRFHIGSVESIGLLTPSGTSPIIEVESVECVTRTCRSPSSIS
jgi:hypothetical protein